MIWASIYRAGKSIALSHTFGRQIAFRLNKDTKDWFYSSTEFQSYFKHGTRSLILKANPPHFTILAASDAYLALVQKQREDLLNHNLFEVFPGSAADPSEQNSVFSSLSRVIENKQTDELPVFKYELYKEETNKWEAEYWINKNEPVLDADGEVAYIINTTTNVTDWVLDQNALKDAGELSAFLVQKQKQNEEELSITVGELRAVNEELRNSQEDLFSLNSELEERVENRMREAKNSENRFRSLIEQLPAAINVFLTQDLIIDLPNDRMLELWGRSLDEVNGKPLGVAMPELQGQPFMQKLRDVIATGISYSSNEEKAFILRKGILEECYFNIVYQPIINEDGSITSCLQIASEVTEEIRSREKIQSLNEELAAANEELAASNDELAASNEELATANEELISTYKQLEEAIRMSEIQRERLYNFFMQAPAGICILSGPELIYELINPEYQKLLPGRNLLNRPIFEALPELANTPLQNILMHVYQNSETVFFTELLVPLAEYEGGALQDHYFTFTYTPRKDGKGQTDGILVFCYEVTEQAEARKKVEQAEESLRIATESAELGTWSYYANDKRLTASSRFKKIFGISGDEDTLREDKISMIHPDHWPVVAAAMRASLEDSKPLYVEVPITEANEGKPRWIRAVGKRIQEDNSEAYITGVVADITEQKLDEQRKNDFIGMVSHEMKTPLTSLSGYLQMLRLKTSNEDAFATNLLGKASKQINKMTRLINGFLNVSRLEAGKIQIDKQRFDMAVLVEEMKEETLSLYNSHIFIFHPIEETYVNADRDKIGQVIQNLISNAVKYSPAKSTINVSCVTINAMAQVSIKDEGIGVKEEDKTKLFDRYYRANNESAPSIAGFGIGLYLCAEIIHRHSGTIQVESEPGKGSIFSFTLPLD